jgi:hypothetical protein
MRKKNYFNHINLVGPPGIEPSWSDLGESEIEQAKC